MQLRHRGVSRRITLGDPTLLSAAQARPMARAVLAENALDGLPTRPARSARRDPRFDAYAVAFWRDYATHWKPSTQSRNRQAINRTLIPFFSRRHVGLLSCGDILAWRDAMRERPGAFNRAIPVLAAMLDYAEKLGHRPKGSNPCRGIARYKRDLPERFLAPPEYRRLFRVLASVEPTRPDVVAAIRLLIFTGARCSAITGLRWEWIDPPYVNLPDSKTGPKRLYLNHQALAILAARKGEGVDPVFPDGIGRPSFLQKPWRMIRRQAALPDVRLHDLRHSFASVGIMHGVPLTHLGKLLGHALPETTARYAHLADTVIAEAAARVSGSIAAALGVRP